MDNVYRRMKMKGEAISQHWPDAEIPPRLQRMIEDKLTEEIDLVEATLYMPDEGDFCYHVIWPEGKNQLLMRRMRSSP